MPSASNTLHSARSESRGDSYIRGGGARFLDTALSQGGSPLLPLRCHRRGWDCRLTDGLLHLFGAGWPLGVFDELNAIAFFSFIFCVPGDRRIVGMDIACSVIKTMLPDFFKII